jgi:hypothetical protein
MSAGQSVPALDTGDRPEVFPANDSTQWTEQLSELVLGGVFLAIGVFTIVALARRGRRLASFHAALRRGAG